MAQTIIHTYKKDLNYFSYMKSATNFLVEPAERLVETYFQSLKVNCEE